MTPAEKVAKIQEALARVREEGASMRSVPFEFGIPRTANQERLSGRTDKEQIVRLPELLPAQCFKVSRVLLGTWPII